MIRTLLTRVAVGTVSVILSLGLAEGMLRVLDVGYTVFYDQDPVTGVALVPGVDGVYRVEGRQDVRISSAGFRDRERSIAKPAGTFRIAVLGDSYTEAMQVALDETFVARLEQRLGGCAALRARPVEVLNFGVSSFGTAQELELLKRRVWSYAPDLVVLAFLTENDVVDNVKEWNPRSEPRPYYAFRGVDLVLDDSFRASLTPNTFARGLYYGMVRASRVMQVVHTARGGARNAALAGDRGSPVPGGTIDDFLVFRNLYRAPADPGWSEAWRLTEGMIVLMSRDVASHGAGFLLVTLSNSIQDHPDPAPGVALAAEMGVPDLFYPDRRLASFAAMQGIASLALAPTFAERARAERIYFHGSGAFIGHKHWNATGHALAAELMGTKICGEMITGVGR